MSKRLFAVSWREGLQQFLRSLIEPLLVFLLFFAGFNRVLGDTYPNELLDSRVVHTNNESSDVIARSTGQKSTEAPRAAPGAQVVHEAVYLLLLIDRELVAKEQVGFTAVLHLGEAFGCHL